MMTSIMSTLAVVMAVVLCLAPTWVAADSALSMRCDPVTSETSYSRCPAGTGSSCKITNHDAPPLNYSRAKFSTTGAEEVEDDGINFVWTGDCGECTATGNVLECDKGFRFNFTSKSAVEITYGNTVKVNNVAMAYDQMDCRTYSAVTSPINLVATHSDFSINSVQVCYNLCTNAGTVCGDPKLVGGDGVMFYFHGRMNQDFCLVSDSDLHINAHFIGKRPQGRTRDFTWVQALGFVYVSHTLTIAAKRLGRWDNTIDHFEITYNGQALALRSSSSWASPGAAMTLTRMGTNVLDLEIKGKMGVYLNAVPIGQHESDVHHYGITGEDCFAHFDMQFRFHHLSTTVNGVLGQTYQPGFVNPVDRSVAMPVMGGAHRYESSSLLATDCAVSQYTATALAQGSALPSFVAACGSSGLPNSVPGGITCRR